VGDWVVVELSSLWSRVLRARRKTRSDSVLVAPLDCRDLHCAGDLIMQTDVTRDRVSRASRPICSEVRFVTKYLEHSAVTDVVLEACASARGGLEAVFLADSASPRPHTVLPRSRPYCLGLGSAS